MKDILLTGVSGGLGRHLARTYLKEGNRVFGFDIKKRDICEFVDDISRNNNFYFSYMDVGDSESVKKNIKILEQCTDKLDMIINCSGILPANSEKLLEEFEIDGGIQVFNVNALGPLRVVKAAMPLLKKGREKLIINISSEAGSMQSHADYINRYDYCMSKAALNIQSIILQRYLRPQGIKVFLIHPGWMRTEMGGEEAPLLPQDAAEYIKALVEKRKKLEKDIVLIDYNDTIRPW